MAGGGDIVLAEEILYQWHDAITGQGWLDGTQYGLCGTPISVKGDMSQIFYE